MNVNITNDQGVRPAVVDAIAPFLGRIKDFLPLFLKPEIYVGNGAVAASLHLASNGQALPGEALEKVLAAAREGGYVARASVSGDQRITLGIYGFIVF